MNKYELLSMKIKYLTLGLIAGLLLVTALYLYKIPRCYEDVSIIGTGQFESGRWSTYACGPAVDDYIR